MNSFTLTAVGNLAKNPELTVKGDTSYTPLLPRRQRLRRQG